MASATSSTTTASTLTSTGPIVAYTFDSAPPASFDTAGCNTNYSYAATSGGHDGVAVFNGAFSTAPQPAFPPIRGHERLR